MLKKCLFRVLPLFPLLFLCYCHMKCVPAPVAIQAVPPIEADVISPRETPAPLSLYAAGACVLDAQSGRVLYDKNASEPLPMASTTKIMTCLLALENGKPDDVVTFSKRAASMPKVHLGAPSGRAFTLQSLLFSLMLESHNDSAVAIAEHIGGSVEGFAAMMNARATELGMSHTNFVTPNGLDSDGHQSSPYDMCLLAAYACQNQTFLELIRTPSATIHDVEGKFSYSLTNHDAFLTSYSGAIGIKTGFTGKAGYCFVGAAKRNDRTLVSCVLASGWPPDKSRKWSDTKSLMDYGFEHFAPQTLSLQDLSQIPVPVTDGEEACVYIKQPEAPTLLLSPYDEVRLEYSLPSCLKAPIQTDVPTGEITVSVNGTAQQKIPLYPQKSIQETTWEDIALQMIQLFVAF